jgi:hypothetical protein
MKYRKRPVVINALLLRSDNREAVAQWCGGTIMQTNGSLSIPTLEGCMRAELGDWVIQGVKGEFYPCKPDIFCATYEREDGTSV